MAVASFPDVLTLLADGYQETYATKVVRSEFESGPIRQRRFQCRSMITRDVRYSVCGKDNLQTFWDWLNGDIEGGSLWFMWPDPRKCGELTRARLNGDDIIVRPIDRRFEAWEVSLRIESWSE